MFLEIAPKETTVSFLGVFGKLKQANLF